MLKSTSKNKFKPLTETDVLQKVREKIRRFGINEEQVKEAIRWARKERRHG